MIAEVSTSCFRGFQAVPVAVQVQIAKASLPSFGIVGLPDKAISESRERIRSVLYSLGLSLPAKRIIINLAPADLQKEGSHYDLPMTLGLLMALEILPRSLEGSLSMGELGLDGTLKGVRGVLCAAMVAAEQNKIFICPKDNAGQAAWAGDLEILAPRHLMDLINHYRGTHRLPVVHPKMTPLETHYGDISDVRGQELAKRALLLAAAGRHNMLMSGPPGTGKSMLAQRLIGLLPPLSAQEALEVTMVHSLGPVSSENKEEGLVHTRPFRNPHHSVSMAGLVGGGLKGFPGEVSLAHQGVLFLDELPEFSRVVLESLRQCLESKQAVVARANYRVSYPADFQLIAGMNPCPCGYLGYPLKQCHKAPGCGQVYQRSLSGPFLDRIDLFVSVPEVEIRHFMDPAQSPQSLALAQKIVKARDFHKSQQWTLSPLPSELDEQLSQSEQGAKDILFKAKEKMGLSARGFYRVLRLARTIASLEESCIMTRIHVAEALSYRF